MQQQSCRGWFMRMRVFGVYGICVLPSVRVDVVHVVFR